MDKADPKIASVISKINYLIMHQKRTSNSTNEVQQMIITISYE